MQSRAYYNGGEAESVQKEKKAIRCNATKLLSFPCHSTGSAVNEFVQAQSAAETDLQVTEVGSVKSSNKLGSRKQTNQLHVFVIVNNDTNNNRLIAKIAIPASEDMPQD